jgi:hypothetical protein
MKLLVIKLKWFVKLAVSTMALSGLIACKETDGFSASQIGVIPAGAEAQAIKLEMTPTVEDNFASRLKELENIEEDIALKDENITGLQLQIDDLKSKLESNNDSLSSSASNFDGAVLDTSVIDALKAENEKSQNDLEQLTSVYNQYVEDRIAKDKEMMDKFSSVVSDLSKYETSDKSNKFKSEVIARLEIYEADREKLAEMILSKEENIKDLSDKIASLESSQNDSDIAEKDKLSEELVLAQSNLNEMTSRLSSLEKLVKINTCAMDPSSCPESEVVTLEDVNTTSTVNPKILELSEQIKELELEKVSLNDLIQQIDTELLKLDTRIALAKTNSDLSKPAIINPIFKLKSEHLKQKSEALDRIKAINSLITQKQKQVVSY